MALGIIGMILAGLLVLSGWASMRRPLKSLVEFDAIGRRMLATRGEAFTLRFYRIYGLSLLLAGLVGLYVTARYVFQ